MKYRHVMFRRTMLRGAGSVAIGLPFVEAMAGRSAFGAGETPPERCLTIFFGLGVPPSMAKDGFGGALAPLTPFKDKLAIFRNVNMPEAGGQGHPKGGLCVFVGKEAPSESRAGGATIEQVVKKELYPQGAPTPLGTVAVANFFRRRTPYQEIRCWNEDGSRVTTPLESPADTFKKLFGDFMPASMMGTDATAEEKLRVARAERSILDTVIEQYRHLTGPGSNLGPPTRTKISDHLERIRALERRIFPTDAAGQPMATVASTCDKPGAPRVPQLPYYKAGPTDRDAFRMTAVDFKEAARQNAELFAMGLRCDLFRFGNIQCEAPGGHTALSGVLKQGNYTYNFDDSASGHYFWHKNQTSDMRGYATFIQSLVAQALSYLDDSEFPDANGKTILDNALTVIGTEVGTNHDHRGVLHAVAGGAGRLKLGGFRDEAIHGVDLYNTCLKAVGVDRFVGDRKHFKDYVSSLA